MTNQPRALDRKTLLEVFDACEVAEEFPDGAATVTVGAAMWRRLKRVAEQRTMRPTA